MSVNVHDEYCGSFGKFSDCSMCYVPEQATMPKQKKRLRLGVAAKRNNWIADALKEIERLMMVYFPERMEEKRKAS